MAKAGRPSKATKTTSIAELISQMKQNISVSKEPFIPDIITFCESKEYLNLSGQNIILKPVQKMILKVFYRGSKGNKNIKLTDEEIALCERLGLTTNDKGNVLEKYYNNETFSELVLVWGRQAGKDFLISIIALYEVMKLLECPGGDPYKFYDIAGGSPINILTIANSKEQAKIAFDRIYDRLMNSPYFQNKYLKEGLAKESIAILTSQDKKDNEELLSKNNKIKTFGSIVIIVGHSNSATLIGKSCFVLIFDEVGSYKKTAGPSSGQYLYSKLAPTTIAYKRLEPILNEDGIPKCNDNGIPLKKIVYDGKIIIISSPRAKEGILWELFSTTHMFLTRLSCRLATWLVFPEHTRESLRQSMPGMNEIEFETEFGAEFAGLAGSKFFSEDLVEACFKNNLKFRMNGEPGKVYFVHLDPANRSDNYALAMVHKEVYINKEGTSDFVIVVDLLKYWHPTKNKPVVNEDVDREVINLRKYFNISLVTFDLWNAVETKARFRKAGLPHMETHYGKRYKMVIYDELEDLVNSGRLIIPMDGEASALLKEEMKSIKKKITPQGFSVEKETEGDGCKTDDLADSLAGACYNALDKEFNKLPETRSVDMGVFVSGNDRLWQSMSGAMGYGSGQAVADALKNREAYKLFKK